MKYKKDIIQLGGLVILLLGICFWKPIWYKLFPVSEQYGVKYNKTRARLGIYPLPADWTTTGNEEKETKIWFPPAGDTSAVQREMKVIGVEDGRIRYENDFIVKPRPNREELTISYRYMDTAHRWSYALSSDQTNARPYPVTKEQVDSILHSWNFHQ
jgi:hypothetical protein